MLNNVVLFFLVVLFSVACNCRETQFRDIHVACGNETSLYDFVKCYESFIKPDGSISANEFARIKPKKDEQTEWRRVSFAMLHAKSAKACERIEPSNHDLASQVMLRHGRLCKNQSLQDTCKDYCLLYEVAIGADGKARRGLGIFASVISPREGNNSKNLHISAAHPITDNNVHLQAAFVAENTPGVKSLTITGATRWAVANKARSKCQRKHGAIDAAHNRFTMFHASLLATREWQYAANGGGGSCKREDCAFIQFHGMRAQFCSADSLFISSGFKDRQFYKPNLPAMRVARAVAELKPRWIVSTVLNNTGCNLVAATNVFGRIVNGVPEGYECGRGATVDEDTHAFVHVESHYYALRPDQYWPWPNALVKAFTLKDE